MTPQHRHVISHPTNQPGKQLATTRGQIQQWVWGSRSQRGDFNSEICLCKLKTAGSQSREGAHEFLGFRVRGRPVTPPSHVSDPPPGLAPKKSSEYEKRRQKRPRIPLSVTSIRVTVTKHTRFGPRVPGRLSAASL